MTNTSAGAPAPAPQMGYGKAVIGGLIQPFCAALAAVVIAVAEAKIGHPLGSTLSAAVETLITTPVTIAAVLYTPHNLFGAS